jgi:uncharacterized protein YraI
MIIQELETLFRVGWREGTSTDEDHPMKLRTSLLAAVATIALAAPALAIPGTALTDLPLRAGPGPMHPVIATVERNSTVEVEGCNEGGQWCQVSAAGRRGWVFGSHLSAQQSGQPVIITEQRQALQVPIIQYQEQRASATTTTTQTGSTGAAAGAGTGVIAGALLGGPVGALIGGIAGLTAGAVVDPPGEVRTYVTTNKVEPVYLEGEVVVGAALPANVKVYEIPNYRDRYAYVNGRTVLVEPGTNKIVYVYR